MAKDKAKEQRSMDVSPCTVELADVQDAEREEGDYGFIKFQCGPIAEEGENGTTIEAVTGVLIDRLEGFQVGPFACEENRRALGAFKDARNHLEARTAKRQEQGVEGVNAAHES